MCNLIIDNYVIEAPIKTILYTLRKELTNGKLSDIIDKGDNILVTCPKHKDGHEGHPSCFVYCGDRKDVEYGVAHCFTCGEVWPLWKFVAICFDDTDEFGKEWLISHFGLLAEDRSLDMEAIRLKSPSDSFLDESVLNSFDNYHPYLESRNISVETANRFKLKFDRDTKSIVFPVYDYQNRLKFLTRRSVESKRFIIDKDADKSNIYLMNEIYKCNCKKAVVCESQFNALTCWQNGIPAVALLGSGTTDEQMLAINKSPVRHWILGYDNDPAGRKGAWRFKKLVRKDVFIDEVTLPEGKDINDLSSSEFEMYFGQYK